MTTKFSCFCQRRFSKKNPLTYIHRYFQKLQNVAKKKTSNFFTLKMYFLEYYSFFNFLKFC